MNHKLPKFKSGFSMIELLIVIAIMAIMMGFVLTSSSSSNKSASAAEAAARQIAAQLRGLQSEALTGKITGGTKSCSSVFQGINNTDSFNTYHIQCGTVNTTFDALNVKLKKVIISSDTSDFYVSFATPGGKVGTVNVLDGDGNGIKKILVTSGSSYASVCINSMTGNIEEKKGDVGC